VRPEHQIDELSRGGEARIAVATRAAGRTEYRELDVAALGNDARLDEARELCGMIDMQMREQHDIEATQIRARLAGAHKGAGSRIHENARRTVEHDQVAGAGAAGRAGAAGAEHQQGQPAGRLIGGRAARGKIKRSEQQQ